MREPTKKRRSDRPLANDLPVWARSLAVASGIAIHLGVLAACSAMDDDRTKAGVASTRSGTPSGAAQPGKALARNLAELTDRGAIVPTEVDSSGHALGSTPLQTNVSHDGAAQVTVPLWVPPGRAGMTPGLALQYSSRGGNGVLGIGWELTGAGSVIATCNPPPYWASLTQYRHYCLDGQYLKNTYVSNEFVIENDPGTLIIPIRENDIGRIVSWEVRSRDGSIATFEGREGLWFQTKRSDRHGNTVEIRWNEDLRVVTEILYSHEVPSNGSQSAFVNRIVFEYSFRRPDQWQQYSAAGRYWVTKRLQRVEVRGRYEDTADTVLREYKLEYDEAALSRRSRLRTLQECAFGVCLRPKKFVYTEPLPSYSVGYYGRPADLHPGITYLDVADLDSDGHDDLIYRAPDPDGIPRWWATTYQFPDHAQELGLPVHTSSIAKFPPIFADINADGAMDVLLHVAGVDGSAAYYQHYRWDWLARRFFFVDDSNVERLAATAGLPDFVPIVYQATGSGFYSVKRLITVDLRWGEYDFPGKVWMSRSAPSREAHALANYDIDYMQRGDITLPIDGLGTQCFDNPIAIPLDEDGDGQRRLVRQRWELSWDCPEPTICKFWCRPQPWLDLDDYDVPVTPEGGAYYALDVMGDGGDDLVSMEDSDFYLRPNAIDVRLSYTLPAPYSFGEQERDGKDRGLRFFDWNLDGATDILLATEERTGGGVHPVMLTYDYTQGGLQANPIDTVATGDVVDDVSMTRVLDWNGDGLPDIATVRDDVFTISQKHSVATDTLVRIEENDLAEVEFEYAPTSDTTLYSSTTCAVGFDCLARGTWLVKKHVVHDRPGGHTTYHKYDSGFFSRYERRWLGMKSHTVSDVTTGAVTVTSFDPTRRETNSYKYPYAGLPVEVEHRLGNQTSTTTSTYGFRVSSRGNCTNCFEYPQLDRVEKRVVEVVNGATSELVKTVEEYKFDDLGNVTRIDRTSAEETSTSVTAVLNDTTTWLIGLPTRVTTTSVARSPRKSATRVVSSEYDSLGAIERLVIEPDAADTSLHSATEYIWQDGLLSSVTVTANEEPSSTTTYTYRDGQLHTVENALGHVSTVVYTGLGTAAATSDPSGVVTTMTYDGFGRPRSVSPADGGQLWVESVRDGEGIATTTYRAGGGSNVTRLDRFGRVIQTRATVAGGHSIAVSYEYDYRNLLSARTLPYGASDPVEWVTYVRDVLGRPTQETIPRQPVRSWSYSGRKAVETVGTRVATTWRDSQGRVVKANTTTGNLPQRTVSLIYGPFNTVVRRDYGNSTSQSFVYDAWNRLTSASDPDRGLREFEYNGYGELKTEQLANGVRSEYEYDELGRLAWSTSTENASRTDYDWDTETHPGVLESVTIDGALTSYGYDDIGRLASRSLSIRDISLNVDFTYDTVGRLSTVTYPEGAIGRPSVRYEYDDVGELLKLHDENTSEALWERTSVNERGQHTGHRLGNGVTSTFQYNAAWRILERASAASATGERVLDFEWRYGLLDNRVDLASRIDHVRGKQQRYAQYNDQLYSWSVADADASILERDAVITYEYGNGATARRSMYGPGPDLLEQQVFDVDWSRSPARHQIATGPWGSYLYDASGNQVERPGQNITYTSRGLPRTITDEVAGTFQFAYDAAGGRVMKERDDGSYTVYLDKLYERRRAANGDTQDVYYFMATGLVGQLTVKTPASGGPAAEMHYFHGDEQGSVRVVTDSAGEVVERLDYDAFGQRIDLLQPNEAASPSAITTRGYTGHEHDDDLGLINMGGRVYDPALMRFLSPDPLTAPMTESRAYDPYSYARLNPARYVDPSGFSPCGVSICISSDGVSNSWNESGHRFSFSPSATGGGFRGVNIRPATSSLRPTTASTMGRAETAWAAVPGMFISGGLFLESTPRSPWDSPNWYIRFGEAIAGEVASQAGDALLAGWRFHELQMQFRTDPIGALRGGWKEYGALAEAIWDDPGVVVDVAGSVADQVNEVRRAAAAGDPEAAAKIAVFAVGVLVGKAGAPSRVARGVQAGEAGAYGALRARSVSGDMLTPHHMPQAAMEFTTSAEGGSLVLRHPEHVLTRTYGGRGAATLRAEQGMSFRDVLARDIRDIRQLFGPKYDQGLRDLLQYYRRNFPELMAR